jgi:hypothetical protein
MRHSSSSTVFAALLLAAACSHHDREGDAAAGTPASDSLASDRAGAGELRIVSVDNGVDLALVRDSISGGLSQQALAKARQQVDTAKVSGAGLGASIERLVKSSVSTAIGTRMVVPLAAVKDVRYENGRLVFEWNGRPATLFESTKVNGKPLLESFGPDDARRFVDAVRARKRALGQM